MLKQLIELLFYEEEISIVEKKFLWGLYHKKEIHIRKKFTLKKVFIIPYILSKLNQPNPNKNRITPDYIKNKYFLKNKNKVY